MGQTGADAPALIGRMDCIDLKLADTMVRIQTIRVISDDMAIIFGDQNIIQVVFTEIPNTCAFALLPADSIHYPIKIFAHPYTAIGSEA